VTDRTLSFRFDPARPARSLARVTDPSVRLRRGGSLLCRTVVDDPSTEELKHRQAVKEQLEREGVADAVDEADAASHRRRAEKAAYLHDKLVEREASEEEPPEPSRRDLGT
jgi:hypothetical protein